MSDRTQARLRVQNPEGDGKAVFEEVPIEPRHDGLAAVLCSPVLVENLAAGDVIRVHRDGAFEVVQRGGNVSVQYFRASPPNRDAEQALSASVKDLGGRLDAEHPGALVYTIPLKSAGFEAIEQVFDSSTQREPGTSWMFGNVYDPVDGHALNWWA